MHQINDLERLEISVEKMLGSMNGLRQEKTALQAIIDEKDQKIKEMEDKITALSSDSESISNRVNSLISSIEDWEESLESGSESTEPGSCPDKDMQGRSAEGDNPAKAQPFDMSE